MKYFTCHNHTQYSNIRMLDCINKESKLIDCAIELGLSGIAITDHESVGSHIKALKHMKSLKSKAKEILTTNPNDIKAKQILDFKLALGNEIYLCRDGLSKENYIKGQDGFWHFILIAKDKEGHKQLRELSSRAWNHSFRQYMERVPTYYSDLEEVILPNPGHIIASTACLGGQFPKLITEAYSTKNFKRVDAFINWCISIFKEDFYIEIQAAESEEQKFFNKLAVTYAKEHNLKYIVTTDTHYLRKSDRPIHKSFLNSSDGDREVDMFYEYCYMMDEQEIVEHLSSSISEDAAWQSLINTHSIYYKIEEYDLSHNQIIPRIPIDWDRISTKTSIDSKYENIQKFINSEYEEDQYFILSIINKGKELDILDEAHIKRIDDECGEIWAVSEKINERLSAYFLIIQKVVELGWTEGDSLVGPWRGSAGALLTAYLLDIIQGDPLESPAELPYWRCISRGRAELADFDLDFQASKRERVINAIKNYIQGIGGEVVSVCTYGTETSKAALQTACRGIGEYDKQGRFTPKYDPELGTYLSSMVPIDRGFVRSLTQCEQGDEEKGYKPVKQLLDEMNKYPDIWEVAKGIEGLISRRGVHAAGILITNDKFTELNATMRSPKGQLTSQWELYDSEYVGNIKFDLLTVDALDRIRTTLELLSEYGLIEWQDSLKSTYDKYLKPNQLDYESEDMWKLVGENKIISLFQFDTPVGLQCARTIQPKSLLELAQANSLMRLMPEGSEKTPTEEFAEYKMNPRKLFHEIQTLKATKEEKELLFNFMKSYGGVLDSQESLMLAVMLPFTRYTIDEANKVRKVIAKKKIKEVEQTKQDYFKRGRELGTSEDILHYIWDVQASRQMGYSFSIIHTVGYSTIAVQELNLAFKYPDIYWNTACLIVDSAGIEEEEEDDGNTTELLRPTSSIGCRDFEVSEGDEEDVDEGEEESEEGDGEVSGAGLSKKSKKVVNYGKVSAAIGKMKQAGVKVVPPDINKSSFTFVPDAATGTIIYGIKGITRINDEYAAEIIANRPYESFEDFITKIKSTKLQLINLIKSGAFDSLESNREELMREFIISISGCKNRLTLQNMPGLINYGVIPEEYNEIIKIYNFNKFLKKNKYGDFYLLDDYCQQFYNERFNTDLLTFEENKCLISQKDWDKIYKKQMDNIRPFLSKPSSLSTLNERLIEEQWSKYCSGSIAKWEMDSIGFYNTVHELDGIDLDYHDVVNFFELPEEPEIQTTFTTSDGKTIPLYKLVRIAGTVLERDKLKNTVTLLTPDGVVKVKIFKPQFVKYDRQLTERDEETGKKKVIEKSWFSRGNKLIISGIRRDTNFFPKLYKKYKYDYPIGLIDLIDYEHGEIHIRTGREV